MAQTRACYAGVQTATPVSKGSMILLTVQRGEWRTTCQELMRACRADARLDASKAFAEEIGETAAGAHSIPHRLEPLVRQRSPDWHMPVWTPAMVSQRKLQDPQFLGSLVRSTQIPLQQDCPSAHTFPQAPQLQAPIWTQKTDDQSTHLQPTIRRVHVKIPVGSAAAGAEHSTSDMTIMDESVRRHRCVPGGRKAAGARRSTSAKKQM